ncbi:uncharacterized protein LOC118423572 [Branchiostoma floridae]|uniref:Uncharacterized protein LOC118423572 n=1 Tax=Branchiostoma floridae TaxID=7739 RepID=A0A9J7LUT7_BRAFL|nr:uncharacterized protein LOC118423572 [Branchiostoma floridae]
MSRLAVGVLVLAAAGLLSHRPVLADDSHEEGDAPHDEEEHGHQHIHECPEGYEEFEGYCYYFSDTTATFSEAAAQCEAMDGRLAAPDCHDEHAAEFFYRAVAWISADTETDCGTGQPIESELPFICMHAPTCDDPPFMNNTVRFNCEPPYDQQEVCVYSCITPGFHLFEGTNSSSTATCLDGNWHGPFMSCNSDCPEPIVNPGVAMMGPSCEAPYITGDMCFFECLDEEGLNIGDHDMSCFDGVWIHADTDTEGTPLICE